jgi:aldehyde:ferredoxin oxidoreductase
MIIGSSERKIACESLDFRKIPSPSVQSRNRCDSCTELGKAMASQANKLFGYTGRILRIDLSSGKIDTFGTEPYIDKFLGGRGIMAKLHWDMVTHKPKRVGAFDPENPFVIMTGPLTATLAPSSGRTECSAISPQTYPDECYTESSFGLHFGPELKFAGFDGMVVTGKAERPVWILINNRKVQIRDGRHLWGLDMFDAQERVWKELGDHQRKTQILVAGPAGENLVRSASIMHGSSAGAGQGGFGAVWGSKHLKAIAVSFGQGRSSRTSDENFKGGSPAYLSARSAARNVEEPRSISPSGLVVLSICRHRRVGLAETEDLKS